MCIRDRLRTVLVQRLRQDGHLAAAVGTAAEAIDLCREQSPDLLVSAEILEQNTAMRLAQQLGSSVIVLTARSGVEAVSYTHLRAHETSLHLAASSSSPNGFLRTSSAPSSKRLTNASTPDLAVKTITEHPNC